jgi:polyisoprenoid-binding protein YceI
VTYVFVKRYWALGCSQPATYDEVPDQSTVTDSGESDPGARPNSNSGQIDASRQVAITPNNAKIVFVATHVGEPNPRTGGFESFKGTAILGPENKTLESLSVEIDTSSIWTQIERLTNHLKSPDFFDVNEFPTAKFQTTNISAGDEPGQFTITGDLTLLDTTKEISFPTTVNMKGDDLTLNGQFKINRTDFGMDFGPERVEDEVALTIAIGEKTEPLPLQEAGGGRRGSGRGRGGSFDPAAMFDRRDENGDGKLSGDEIPDRMREDLSEIDADDDGAISLEEFQERMRQFRDRGGRRGSGSGRGAGE